MSKISTSTCDPNFDPNFEIKLPNPNKPHSKSPKPTFVTQALTPCGLPDQSTRQSFFFLILQ